MKANELSCKSLMIGDWVWYKNQPYQIRQLGIFGENRDGDDYPAVCVGKPNGVGLILERNEIEPIPLTPEILEKNGWRHEFDKTDYMVKYDLGKEGKNCWMMWAIKEHNLDIQRQDEKLDVYNLKVSKVVIPCDYVHRLQHALCVCGIEKEIEL